jgi:hypothetical protein
MTCPLTCAKAKSTPGYLVRFEKLREDQARQATEGSGASTATAADDAGTPPISELDRQEAWRLLDWAAAFFLCSSLVQLVLRRNIVAAISGCVGIVAAMAHQWWLQRPPGAVDDSSDEALELAMTLMVHFPLHNTLVIGTVSGVMQ